MVSRYKLPLQKQFIEKYLKKVCCVKILIAEDDERLSDFVVQFLKRHGVEVDVLYSGDEIEYYALNSNYDVLILDWMLPKKSGVEACQSLRIGGYQGGILMLTARTTLQDKIDGFACGADDYLIKPFELDELYARVHALSRRAQHTFNNDIFDVEGCKFNCSEKTITYNGFSIKLTVREFQIIEILARNAGQVVSRDILFDRVWGLEKDVSNNSVDVYIKMIRKKLEQIKNKQFIHNIRSVGYRWEEKDV